MVYSCSINDSSTSYLCFLKMKRPLNKEVYGNACVCSVPAPAFYWIFTILETLQAPGVCLQGAMKQWLFVAGTDRKWTVSSLEKTVPSLYWPLLDTVERT